MKIHELLNEDQFEPQVKELPQSVPFNLKKMGQKTIQTQHKGGAYGMATPDPNDPFMYRKKLRQPSILNNDAYYQYIKACMPYMDSNPFFPKVYNVKIKKDPKGLTKPMYDMEKLIPMEDAYAEIGYDELDEIFRNKYLIHPESEHRSMIRIINSATSQNDTSDIKDEHLIQAINLIRKVYESNPKIFDLDMHSGNFMVRNTSTGPQLVITDPIADDGRSIVGYNVFHGGWPTGQAPGQTNNTPRNDGKDSYV